MRHRAVGHDREIVALACDPRAAERHHVLAARNVLLRRPVVELRLEHDDGVRIADRRREQALGVGRRRRYRDLHAGRVHVVRLRRVVVELGRADATAVGHADRQRERHRASRPPAVAADVVDELIESRVAERVVLHLHDRAPAGHAQPDRSAHDPCLRERRVDAPVRAEALLEPGRRAEDATELADVLAHDEHRRIALHLHVERVVDGLHEELLSHRGSFGARPARPAATPGGPHRHGRRRAKDREAARPRPLRFRPA